MLAGMPALRAVDHEELPSSGGTGRWRMPVATRRRRAVVAERRAGRHELVERAAGGVDPLVTRSLERLALVEPAQLPEPEVDHQHDRDQHEQVDAIHFGRSRNRYMRPVTVAPAGAPSCVTSEFPAALDPGTVVPVNVQEGAGYGAIESARFATHFSTTAAVAPPGELPSTGNPVTGVVLVADIADDDLIWGGTRDDGRSSDQSGRWAKSANWHIKGADR